MNFVAQPTSLFVEIAQSDADLLAAQRLRYDVFVAEFGAGGDGFDHQAGVERDGFDAFADHLILKDRSRPEHHQIVGTYRLMTAQHAALAGRYYSADEYNLTPILTSGRNPLEMSRSCLHPDYRGGTALLHLWQGLGAYVLDNDIDVIFGVASLPGADVHAHAGPLALLHNAHLAPAHLRPIAHGTGAIASDSYAHADIDRRAAMIAMPALIKAYLRMGGVVGDGAYRDTDFGTTDVCMVLETAQLNARQRAFLGTS